MEITWINYLVGMLVSLAAWFVFLWAIRDGQFRETEETARRMLENEVSEEGADGTEKEHEEDRHRLMEKVGLEKDSHLHQDYEYASGIVERAGIVPRWLKVVYVSLVVWAIYYIIRYWSGE